MNLLAYFLVGGLAWFVASVAYFAWNTPMFVMIRRVKFSALVGQTVTASSLAAMAGMDGGIALDAVEALCRSRVLTRVAGGYLIRPKSEWRKPWEKRNA